MQNNYSQAGRQLKKPLFPLDQKLTRTKEVTAKVAEPYTLQAISKALPYEDAAFDVVVSRSAIHHFPDPAAVLREMARVVRAGGRMVTVDVMAAETPSEAALHNALEILRDPSHVRMLPQSELHAMLVQAGLEVESCVAWTNHREFEEWLAITNAPERRRPLRVVMEALARAGASAGIGLRMEDDKIRFEHTAALTVAIRRLQAPS